MKGEFEEFSEIFLKKYNMKAWIVDKYWREDLKEYIYCIELDKSLNDDPGDLLVYSLTYDDIQKMMN